MTVKIDSTTDSAEAVTAALGDLAKAKVAEEKSAPAPLETDDVVENAETSDDSEEAETQSGENEDAEDESSKDGEKPKKKNGFKKKIDKLTKRNHEKDREIEFWKQKAMDSTGQKPESKSAPQQIDTSSKPRASDYETHEAFVEALTDWKTEQKFAARESKAREDQIKSEQHKKVESFQSKVASFKESHQDFDEALEDVDDIPISPAVQELIIASDNGPELMYQLAKNREEYERICKLSPLAAAREMGRFEAKLQSSEAPTQAKTTTKAPPPLKPVNAKASASVKDPDSLPYREWKAWREQQMKKGR